jgi:TRAP-type C4-dicarboxylate transport system substrate-binding protein
MKRRHILVAATALAAARGIAAAPAVTWKWASGYRADSFHGCNLSQFAADVEAATEGALRIDLLAGNPVPMARIPTAVQDGQLQGGEVILTGLGGEIPAAAADAVPFIVHSYDDAWRLWQAQRPPIEREFQRRGLRGLYAVPWPPQGLYSARPITAVQDLHGLRMRTYNATTVRIAEMVGAQAVDVPMVEVSQALAEGRIDAMLTSAVTGVEARVWERLKFYYEIKAWFPKNIVMVSQAALDGLAPAHRNAVLEAARQAEPRGWAACKTAARESLDELRRQGMQVEPAPLQLRQGLRRLGERLSLEWLRDVGPQANAIFVPYYAGQS